MLTPKLHPTFNNLFRLLTAPSLNFAVGMISDVVHNHRTLRYRLLHYAEMVAYAVYALRFTLYALLILNDYELLVGTNAFNSGDFCLKLVVHFSAGRDRLFGFTPASLFTFGLLSSRLIYFSPVEGNISWLKFYHLIVLNSTAFSQNEKSEKEKKLVWWRRRMQRGVVKRRRERRRFVFRFFLTPLDRMLTGLTALSRGDFHRREGVLASSRLTLFPNLSYQTRARLLLCIALGNFFSRAIIFGLYITFLILIPYYVLGLFLADSLLVNVLQMADFAVFAYLISASIHICCLFLSCAVTCTTYAICHFSELNAHLNRVCTIKISGGRSGDRLYQSWVTIGLKYYLSEHITSSMIILRANKGLWDRALLAAVLCQIPSNVHLMSRVLREPDAFLLWYILAMQFAILSGICLMTARYTKTIHAGAKMLPRVQALLPGEYLQMKVSTLTVYELLTADRKIGLSIGSLATITNSLVYQILLAYIMYVIMLLQFFQT